MEIPKDLFWRMKEDLFYLSEEVNYLRECFEETNGKISEIKELVDLIYKKNNKTQNPENKTNNEFFSTDNLLFKALKDQNKGISTGNEGVSTDRQTHRQTDRHIEKEGFSVQNSIDSAAEIIDSLDNLKKELRLKFKKLTEQEMIVFSAIYQLEEEKGHSDYKMLSERLKLTESSIRDYVRRLILKGVPIIKSKVNNKEIHLNISSNLKKVASLDTLLRLRSI